MQIKSSPLNVIINPPGAQSGMPGDALELHAIVINQGNQDAVIDVFFDEASETLHQWSNCDRERLALAPQQSSEVTFRFQIPFDALEQTYSYTLVFDSPEHYPEDTPIQYPRQIKVLLKEQTVIRVNDPTFSVRPITNPNNPAILKLGEPLQVVVTVENRSNRVDRFRLTCPDLEENWLTIRYLTTNLEGPGLLSEPSGLELNPASQGQILLQFHPPADTLAGSYSPTLHLHSANSPDLVLLDLAYIQLPAVYRLDVELNTILGKVSRSSGQYEVKLANQGNTLRELAISTKSRDEAEIFTYQCEPPQVQVLPSRSVEVNLTVKPMHWWRQPLIGAGLEINFVVELHDKQGLPLPVKLPQGTLVWKPRPWWQFLLLVLAALGLLGGVALLIWLTVKSPDPPSLDKFTSDSPSYIEGDEVRLSWQIQNFNQLSKLDLSSEGPVARAPVQFDFNKGIPDKLKPLCQKQEQILACNNFKTGATKPGDYTFTLKPSPRKQGAVSSSQTLKVKIAAKPAAAVVSFQLDKNQYTKGDLMRLSWQIQNQDQLSQLKIIGKAEDGTGAEFKSYTFSQGRIPDELTKSNTKTLQRLCKPVNQVLACKDIPVAATKAGKYTFELQAFSKLDEPPNSKPTETKVEILPKPFKIVYFTLNGSEQPNIVFKDGEPVTLSWKVEGEDINVEISTSGNVDLSGSQQLIANLALPSRIEIIVSDKFGHKATKGFSIRVETPPSSQPSPATLPSSPTEFDDTGL